MKAVILVGGEGTRLRPLTTNCPKPLIPLVNRPFLDHILYLLRTHGIHDVVLAVAYKSDSFEQAYGDGSPLGMRLTYVREEAAMGTGGAIKNVEGCLEPGETFLVFNGDILTDIDLTDMLRKHKASGSVCTISLTPVEDPSMYGVVDLDSNGRIQHFTEKPKREEATSNWINAGTYIIEPTVLDRIPEGRHYMVERGLFPGLLAEGQPMYGYKTEAYWLDIGTPGKYLQAQEDLLLDRLKHNLPEPGEAVQETVLAGEGTFVDRSAHLTGPIVLGKGCKIHAASTLTGPLVLGDYCEVRANARLERLVAWNNVLFDEGCICRDSVFGESAQVGRGAEVLHVTIVGDGARIGAGNKLNGERVDCGQSLPDK